MSERLLTARQVADRLGVCVETVLRWTRDRKLPGYPLSARAMRYREDEIEAWLAEQRTGTATRRLSDTRSRTRRGGGYPADRPVPFPGSDTRPHGAARTQEDN